MLNRYLPLLIAAILALSGCGGKTTKTDFFGPEEKPKRPKVDTTTKIKRNWSRNLGGDIRSGDAVLSPVLFGQYIYAASSDGRVQKVSAETGKPEWSNTLKKERITGGVGVGGGLVLVGTEQGIVYAFNQEDGSQAWQYQLSSEVLASPVIGDGIVIARSGDGKVYGLSAFDGSEKWAISRQLPRLTLRGDSRPVVTQGIVFAGFSDGMMGAFEAQTGRALWDFPISFPRGSNDIDRLADVDTNPLFVGEFLYVSSYQEVTHALNVLQRNIAWSVDVSSFHSLAYDAAYLYISDKNGVVHQVDRSDGSKVWSQSALKLFSVSAPISVGPYVAISEGDGNLYILSKSDGRILGRHKLGAKTIIGEAIVDSDSIYLLDSNGSLQSLSILNSDAS